MVGDHGSISTTAVNVSEGDEISLGFTSGGILSGMEILGGTICVQVIE